MKTTKFLLLIAILFAAPSLAQQQEKDIFANPQNLKVLADDISSGKLSDTMKSFAMGLGIRCETCHVGEPGTPLETFDFESDEKDMKRKARVMIAMVQEINGNLVPELNDIEKAQRVEVRCVTCHRGLPQPKLIEDVLDQTLADGGVDAVSDEYNKLRTEYYGSHSYDFSEFTLPMYAQELGARDQAEAAITLARINTENFPEAYYSFFVLAELYSSVTQTSAAIDSYRRAAELNERARPFLDAKIAELNDRSD